MVELANPQSEEASVMRSSLVPGMLNMLAYNLNRGADNVRLFEAGSVFEARMAGRPNPNASAWALPPRPSQKTQGWGTRDGGFFDLKGDVENLLHAFQHQSLTYDAQTADYYHPGRSARALMDGAAGGAVWTDPSRHRRAAQTAPEMFWLPNFISTGCIAQGLRVVRYQPLPRYPAVERDFSFVFDDGVTFEKIQQAVIGLGLAELRSFVPVEIFRGGNVPAGKYSLLLRARFQSLDAHTARR